MTDAPFEDEFIRNLNVRLFRLGLAGGAAIIILAVTVAILALKPRVPPYVIALDHGRIVGYAQPFAGNADLAPMVIEEGLKQFIYDARVVTSNSAFEQRNIHTVYAMARGQASKMLDAYYQAGPDHDPVKLGLRGDWRDIHIIRCLKEPAPDTYRVEWSETLHPKLGDPATSNWEATMQIVVGPPDSSNDLNPIGLYVTTLDMQQGDGK